MPTPVRALRWLRMAAVAAGDYHSLGLDETGAVRSWGAAGNDLIGYLIELTDWITGAVHSWGAAGTVGNCVSGDQLEPRLVSALRGVRAVGISARSYCSLVLH